MFPDQANYSRKRQRNTSLLESLSTRVIVLVDVSQIALPKGANTLDTSKYIDGLRLSVLRILVQLSLSCTRDSFVEWTTRFFDSRHDGVGKTPAELKARLRSRKVAQGTRGFTRLTKASFQAFGDACLAVACGLQGDPLARDHETALRRWYHGRKKELHKWAASREVAPQHGASSQTNSRSRQANHKGPSGSTSLSKSTTGSIKLDRMREEGPRRMYDQHDMSTHEVVVRSMLEVLQEFGEADVGDRTDTPGDVQGLVLVLCAACPRTEEEVERFVLRGNFSTRVTRGLAQPREHQAPAVPEMLDAGLGKAIRRALSRGVNLIWQDVPPECSKEPEDDTSASLRRAESSLSHCLSVAGGAEVLRWGRTVGCTALLPSSMALRRQAFRQRVSDANLSRATDSVPGRPEPRAETATRVAVSLEEGGAIDVVLDAARLSPAEASGASRASGAAVDLCVPSSTGEGAPQATPWRLLGTLPLSELWPGCLMNQAWGSTVVLRASDACGSKVWRELLRSLLLRDLAASITLPRRLFEGEDEPNGDENIDQGQDAVAGVLSVAALVPVSAECAVAWSTAAARCVPVTRSSRITSEPRCSGPHLDASGLPSAAPTGDDAAPVDTEGGRETTCTELRSSCILEESSKTSASEFEKISAMRRAQVRRTMQEACLERRRRRQSRCGPGASIRATGSLDGYVPAAAEKRRGLLGLSGSLSPRDSLSLRLVEEGTSQDRLSLNCGFQRRLSAASESSHASCSPRSFRLLDAAAGLGDEDDERDSLTGLSSGPRRALYQAMEEASSRSSLQGVETECSFTPESKDGSKLREAASCRRVQDVASKGAGAMAVSLFPAAGEEVLDSIENVPMTSGSNELPVSFMSDPTFASVSRAPSTPGLLALALRAARDNDAAAVNSTNHGCLPAVADGACPPQTEPSRRDGDGRHNGESRARSRFMAAVRATRQRIGTEALSSPTVAPAMSSQGDEAARDQGMRNKPGAGGTGDDLTYGHVGVAVEATGEGGRDIGLQGEVVEKHEETGSEEDGVSQGVAGLRRQYQEVVRGGKRSPVEFVTRAIPEAVRQMTELCANCEDLRMAVSNPEERHERATALVLAAVASGLTVSPEELSAKHKLNRGGGISAAAGDKAATEARGVMATPAIQKVRDYQLQALMLCQLNVLAMDLPETPGSITAFAALATSGSGEPGEEGVASTRKKRRSKKGKGKRKRNRGGSGEDSAPVRPSDPLPDARRARLENYLQPISTMLDACIVLGVSLLPSSHASGGEGGACAGSGGSGTVDSTHSRAYDGTMADFMGLALVGSFASRLPLTLSALFDDFERPPPDSLSRALAEASVSREKPLPDGSGICSREAGAQASKKSKPPSGDEMPATEKGPASVASGGREPSDPSSVRSRGSSSSGILLSDRASMSHHHYKMSGVLSTFREVRLQASLSSGVSKASVKGDGGGVPGARRSGGGGTSGTGGEGGEWRTSGTHVKGKNGCRTRPARDAKRTAGTDDPPGAGEESPRVGGTKRKTNASERKSKRAMRASPTKDSPGRSEAQELSVPSPSRGRQKLGGDVGEPSELGLGGVLVGETPQKQRQRRGSSDSPGSNRRSGGTKLWSPGESVMALSTIDEGKPLAAEEGVHQETTSGSPTSLVMSPDPGRAVSSRTVDSPGMGSSATSRGRDEASPPSWRATSAASRLFVEESPGEAAVEVSSRRGGRSRSDSLDVSEISRNLLTESPCPERQSQPLVPGSPAA